MPLNTSSLSTKWLGFGLALTGVIMFSAKAVLVKIAYQYNVDYLSLLLLRMTFALPFYLGVIVWGIHKAKKQPKVNWAWLIAFGLLGYYLASLFDFMGLEYIKAGLERIILFVYPTLVVIFGRVFLGTKVNKYQILAIILTYIGIAIVFYQDFELGQDDVFLGGALVLLSAICYAGYLVGSGWLIPKFGATLFTSYAMVVSCLSVIVHFLLTEQEVSLLDHTHEVYLISFAIAIFSTVIPSYMVSFAIKSIGASNFSIFGSFGPVSTILLAFIFLEEKFTLVQGIGTVVVIFGVLMVTRHKEQA